MDLAIIVLKQLIIMLILIMFGIICSKTKIIEKDTNKKLSDLLLYIVSPTVIITAYQQPFKKEVFHGILWTLLLSCISIGLSIILSYLVIRTKDKGNRDIERFALIYNNCGFMGIPLIDSIFGSEGVIYLTAYLTIFNILVWSHGHMSMKGQTDIKSLTKALKAPAVIATVIGFTLYATNIRLPEIVLKSLDYISGMNTPLAMLIAGSTIAVSKITPALKKPSVYYVTILSLFVFPLLTILSTRFIPAPEITYTTVAILSATPVAAIGTIFAVKYDKNSEYSSQIFSVTTILSAITIPLVALCV